MFQGISLWPILAAAIADMILGGIWYSPLLLGPFWMQEVGIKKFDMKNAQKAMFIQFISSLLMAYILSFFLKKMNVTTIDNGIEIAFLLWLGFVATTSLVKVTFERMRWSVYVITASYQLISLMVMAMILTSWK